MLKLLFWTHVRTNKPFSRVYLVRSVFEQHVRCGVFSRGQTGPITPLLLGRGPLYSAVTTRGQRAPKRPFKQKIWIDHRAPPSFTYYHLTTGARKHPEFITFREIWFERILINFHTITDSLPLWRATAVFKTPQPHVRSLENVFGARVHPLGEV